MNGSLDSSAITDIARKLTISVNEPLVTYAISAFCMPQVPFALEFASERPSGNLVTKQLLIYHLVISEKSVE